jgi:hypothetical protein
MTISEIQNTIESLIKKVQGMGREDEVEVVCTLQRVQGDIEDYEPTEAMGILRREVEALGFDVVSA